jgi:DNA-binding MarR family transcriptional regulator
MTDLKPCQRDMLALIERLGSADVSTIAEASGVGYERAKYVIRTLRKRGLVVCSSHDRSARWSTPANLHLSLAAIDAAQRLEREKDNARARKRMAEKRAYQKKYREQDFERWCHGICQRVVPAAEARPLRVTAPNSVFALAQQA